MFTLLTRYLLQFRRVVIPNIGGLELVTKPAELDIARKLIHPPTFNIHFFNALYADKHQIDYIANSLQLDEPTTVEQLNAFGAALKDKVKEQPFTWNGIGLLVSSNGEITFDPETFPVTALEAIPANKVLRENVSHTVLIGEQEVQSHEIKELLQSAEEKREATEIAASRRNYVVVIAWVLALLSIVFIVIYFYNNGFKTPSSGNRIKVNVKTTGPTYH